jgi:ribosomal protein L14
MRARRLWSQAGISAVGVLLLCIGLSTINPPDCSPTAPCQPDLLTAFAVACLAAVCVVGWFHPFVAALAAFAGAAAAISPVVQYSPPMLVLVLVAYVLVITGLALFSRKPRIDPGGARVPVPGTFTVPRFTVASGFAGALLALAVGTLVFGLVRQEQATDREKKADVVAATVVRTPNSTRLVVQKPSGSMVSVEVLSAADYPVGSTIQLRVDDQGLAQPVAEPYNATVWVGAGVFFGWLALGLWARTRQRIREWQNLLWHPQPRRAAWYVPDQNAIYPTQVAVGDKPIAGAAIPVQRRNVVVEPITLYGSGIPGDLFVAATPDEVIADRLNDPPKRARWLLHREDLERFLHRH